MSISNLQRSPYPQSDDEIKAKEEDWELVDLEQQKPDDKAGSISPKEALEVRSELATDTQTAAQSQKPFEDIVIDEKPMSPELTAPPPSVPAPSQSKKENCCVLCCANFKKWFEARERLWNS